MKKRESVTSLSAWVNHPGSFMERLKEHGVTDASVRILQEGFRKPHLDECKILALSYEEEAWIREVVIESHDQIWMVARTVIPKVTLTGPEKELQYLKNRSLGSFLFQDPHLQRSDFDIFPILPNTLWDEKMGALVSSDSSLVARRSVFNTKGKTLLLTEIFFPAVGAL